MNKQQRKIKNKLPPLENIQQLIASLRYNKKDEERIGLSGIMLLRIKSPQCEYKGIHFCISQHIRKALYSFLNGFLKSRNNLVKLQLNRPVGREWFNLYTNQFEIVPKSYCNFDIGTKSCCNIIKDSSIPKDKVIIEYKQNDVRLFLNESSLEVLLETIIDPNFASKSVALQLYSKDQGDSEPQKIWIWNWDYNSTTRIY